MLKLFFYTLLVFFQSNVIQDVNKERVNNLLDKQVMVIDVRTENTDLKKGWIAETPSKFGTAPQAVVVTCVGYMPCDGYGTIVHNSLYQTESYKWSIYDNQDFCG